MSCLALHTGMRLSKMLWLEWNQIDFERRVIRLYNKSIITRISPRKMSGHGPQRPILPGRIVRSDGAFAIATVLRLRILRPHFGTLCAAPGFRGFASMTSDIPLPVI